MDLCAVMVLQSDTEGVMFKNSQWESWNREKKYQICWCIYSLSSLIGNMMGTVIPVMCEDYSHFFSLYIFSHITIYIT